MLNGNSNALIIEVTRCLHKLDQILYNNIVLDYMCNIILYCVLYITHIIVDHCFS